MTQRHCDPVTMDHIIELRKRVALLEKQLENALSYVRPLFEQQRKYLEDIAAGKKAHMITTTLNRIREHEPSKDGWKKILAGLGKTAADDEPLPFAKILEINGLDDALYWCRAEPQYAKEWRLLMVVYARGVEHLNTHPTVKNAIDVAERYANGKATDEELYAAKAAVFSVRAAKSAARDAAMAAGNAARAAAGDEVWFTARAARDAAAGAAARGDSARPTKDAIRAAWEAERKWQEQEFLRVVTETGVSDGYR